MRHERQRPRRRVSTLLMVVSVIATGLIAPHLLGFAALESTQRLFFGLLAANGPAQVVLFFCAWRLLFALQLFDLLLLLGLSTVTLLTSPVGPETAIGILIIIVVLVLLVQEYLRISRPQQEDECSEQAH